jgi:hypothetical protein
MRERRGMRVVRLVRMAEHRSLGQT